MNFCPQCGTKFEPDARFCQECGFDINSVIAINELIPRPVREIPLAETTEPVSPHSEIIPDTPEPTRFSPVETPKTAKPVRPLKPQRRKAHWFWILFILVFLGAAGWFGYTMFFSSDTKTSADIASNIIFSENTTNQKTESNTKSVSLMDQELAKQKSKKPNQSATMNDTNLDDIKPDQHIEKDITSVVILEVGRKEEPNNKNPKNPTKLTLKKPTMITRITTDHYNDGMGTPRGGMITIKDNEGNVEGSFKAFGKTGIKGTPSAKWIAEPNIMLQKGTYFISDSDLLTWSKTIVGGIGFVVVEGYEVE
jgi:hypothetical protein